MDKWVQEGEATRYLERLGTNVPDELIPRYVEALTLTYVGHRGYSLYWTRKDFYSDVATPIIEKLFEKFDDTSAQAFVEAIKSNLKLKGRVRETGQLKRLRVLANILLDKLTLRSDIKSFLELVVDDAQKDKLYVQIGH